MRAAALCFGVSVAALADTKLEIQHTQSGKPAESQSVMITTGKVRMEQSQTGDTVLLFHQSTNTFYALQNDRKTYMTFDPETAGEMMGQMSEMQKQMMAQLEERMAEMPEAEREQMKAMMSKMGQPMGVVAPLWLRAKPAYGGGRGMFDHEVSQAQPVQAREAEEGCFRNQVLVGRQ